MTIPDTQAKYARATALVDAFIVANRPRSPEHPHYLGHLIWCEAKRSGAFKWALIRVACRLLAEQAVPSRRPQQET